MEKTAKQFFQKLAILTCKQKIAIFAFIVVFIVFLPQHFAHAGIGETAIAAVVTILIWIFSALSWAIGKMITLTISIIVIPLLGYNNFADSNIISVGWPLVRDTVNMFVIVVLLVIAIKTMLGFGGNKVAWEQQLPRLFLAVVAVNFSRTLCVLMIDASQVVMMTFVNALQDIAAGNFVGLFQLNSFMGISSDTLEFVKDGGHIADALGYLGSSYLILILLGLVLAILWILVFVFLYRIIILWVLVILSPIAFFMGGVKDIFGEAAGKYGEWWKKFVGAITVGPIMAFFLWLGLAAASQGSIAASEGFELGVEADSSYGLLAEVFQVEKMLSLFIGYIIIIAGFQASSSAAGSLGGVASKLINEGSGMALGKRIAAAPARLAGRGAVAGGRALERRTGITRDVGKGVVQAGGALQERLGGGFVGGLVGGAVSGFGAQVEGVGRGIQKEDKKARREVIDSYSDAQLATTSGVLEKPENIKSLPYEQQKIAIEVTKDLATDKTTQAKVKNSLMAQYGKEEGKKRYKQRLDNAERYLIDNGDKFKADDPANKEKLDKVRKKRVDYVAERVADGKEGLDDLQDVVKDMTPKDFKEKAINNALVKEEAAKRKVRTIRGPNGEQVDVFLLEDVQAGRGGVEEKVQKAANKPLELDDDVDFAEAPAIAISDALKTGQIDINDMSLEEMQQNVDNVVRGLAEFGTNLNYLQPAKRDFFVENAKTMRDDPDTPEVMRIKLDAAITSANNSAVELGVDSSGAIQPGQSLDVAKMIANEPQVTAALSDQITAGRMDGNDLTKMISDQWSKNVQSKLASSFEAAKKNNNSQQMDYIRKSLDNFEASFAAEIYRAIDENDSQAERALAAKVKSLGLLKRQMS